MRLGLFQKQFSISKKDGVDMRQIRAILKSLWVRKLTGKPAFLTIADSESEAPRILSHEQCDALEKKKGGQ